MLYEVITRNLMGKMSEVARRLVINQPELDPGAEEEAGGAFARYHKI